MGITTQPANRSTYVGGTARFNVVAAGSTPAYQWFKGTTALSDGGKISGAHSAELAISGVTSADAGNYSCKVSNPLNNVTSSQATLTVLPIPTSGYDAAVLYYNPLAYWQLNEPAGAATTADHWGAFDGAVLPDAVMGTNGPTPPDFPGFPSGNTCLRTTIFDGNSTVAVPALNLNANTATVLMWIYPLGSQANMTTMFANRSGGYNSINYNPDGVTLSFQWNTWGWDSGVLIPNDQWSLIGMVIEPTTTTVYLGTGGTLTNSSGAFDNPVMTFAGTSYIGCDSGNGTRVFNGYIDDVAFFNRALSTNDIARMYYVALGQLPAPTSLTWSNSPSGLVLTWPAPWTLQQADSVAGPWSAAGGVTSGVPIPMNQPKRFYRLAY